MAPSESVPYIKRDADPLSAADAARMRKVLYKEAIAGSLMYQVSCQFLETSP
jgi:hypothetical protein